MPIEDIEWAVEDLRTRADGYRLYTNYYDGDHPLDFVPADYRKEFAGMLRRLRLNICPAVVDALRDRLKLTGFTSDKVKKTERPDGVTISADPTAETISEIWRRNRLDQRQSQLSKEVIKSGDGYVIVWPDSEGEVTLYPQRAELCTVQYSDDMPGQILKAAKIWVDIEERTRATLYYPDHIERYRSKNKLRSGTTVKASSFEPFGDERNPAEIDNKWDQVPVIHFANRADVGCFGVSELKEVLPLQDALNKAYRDKFVASDAQALRQRYVTGVEAPRDPKTGQIINLFTPGDLWQTAEKDAKFGDLPAADLKPFVDVKESILIDVAIVSGTPLHYFFIGRGEPPSGEALKTAEARLTAKADERMTSFGNSWEEVFKLALRMASKDVDVDAVWAHTEPRDEVAFQTSVIERVQQLGLSKRQGLRELDYVDEEIDRIRTEKKGEQAMEPEPLQPQQLPRNTAPEMIQ